jgi:hypothetical protein
LQITISECFPIAGILITKKLKVGVHILISCVQFEINFTGNKYPNLALSLSKETVSQYSD